MIYRHGHSNPNLHFGKTKYPLKCQPIQGDVERVVTRLRGAEYTVDERLEVHVNPAYRKDEVPS
jgi:hypothetical protein